MRPPARFALHSAMREPIGLMERLPHPKADYYSTSVSLIARDKIIVGGGVNDNYSSKGLPA